MVQNGRPKEYAEIYQVAEKHAQKFFNFYRTIFLNLSMDAKDLIQEVLLVVWETTKKYDGKPFEEMFKLCNKAVKWKLQMLTRDAKTNYKHFGWIFNSNGIDDMDKLNYLNTNKVNNILELPFEELLNTVCTLEEKDLLVKRFRENKTFKEIAEEERVSKQSIQQKLKKIIKKLNRRLK